MGKRYLVVGLAADLARNNVRYAELTVTPIAHLEMGVEPDELAEALVAGRRVAWDAYGVELAWVFDIPGGFEPTDSQGTVNWVLAHRPEGTVGFGLGGPEIGIPRDRRVARRGDLHRQRRFAAHSGGHWPSQRRR